MYKRPQFGESDEDLLKLQEEFIKQKAENKVTPAAKIDISGKYIRFRKYHYNNRYLYLDKKVLENQELGENEEVLEQLSNTFEEIPNYKNLGRIIEKKDDADFKPSLFKLEKSGFPVPKRREVRL